MNVSSDAAEQIVRMSLEGMEVADDIVRVKRDASDKPLVPQVMESIRVDTFGQVYPFEQI